MAADLQGVFSTQLQEKILSSKILVVGAGGIGCEILKNLVLSGFPDIEIIDLDTIDLSNLNRQFLFHTEHVGKSKAEVARESALKFNPDVKIKAYHDSITSNQYGVNFFKKFNIVLNALDNRAARNHVNRMCLNADVPLVESGTAGYNGQVEVIKKGLTQCYECTPKAVEKTFPGCTIRNTPSEPIHCIVWAKHLFNQLFGETVDGEDISPDIEDPELQSTDSKDTNNIPNDGNIVRLNTRQWAREVNYDAPTLFNKFFKDDIAYLLQMSDLWKSRSRPLPMSWYGIAVHGGENLQNYHEVWSIAQCAKVFEICIEELKKAFLKKEDEVLVWDKDDQFAMDFVAACANLRAFIFGIERKSRFEVKSMAGNIIPAIATTNAITAGIVVLKAFKVIQGDFDKCQTVYMRLRQNPRQQILIPEKFLSAPSKNCYVCSADPAIYLKVDTNQMRIKELRDDVLIKALNMVNPDVMIDAKANVIISSEEGETTCNEDKLLKDMGIVDGVLLKCDDFFQNYVLGVVIVHYDADRNDSLFEVVAEKDQLKPKEADGKVANHSEQRNGENEVNNKDMDEGPSTSKSSRIVNITDDDNDNDLTIVEDEDATVQVTQATDNLTVESPDKVLKKNIAVTTKRKQNIEENSDDDITEVLHSDDETGPSQRKRTRIVESDII